MTVAIYAGSFDPFHAGHLDVVRRASEVFERVVVLIAANPSKAGRLSLKKRRAIVVAALGNRLGNVVVRTLRPGGKTRDYAKRCTWIPGYRHVVLIRGIRDEKDLLAEAELEDFNEESGIRTVYFSAKLMASSTKVWNKIEGGFDIGPAWSPGQRAAELIVEAYNAKKATQ